MTNIFIGGSRKIARLAQPIQQRIDNGVYSDLISTAGSTPLANR